jgi:DNA-binding NarL/FixJ family response regulator
VDIPLLSTPARATVCSVADPSFNAKPRHGGAAASPPIRVLTVDDQAIFLRALRQLVGAAPGVAVVGEAQAGAEALDRAAELRPDLILLDVRMPGMDGVETARRLLAGELRTTIVLFSLEPLLEVDEVLEFGVAAFVRKQDLSVRTLQSVWRSIAPAAAP